MLSMRNSEENSTPLELPPSSPLLFVVSGPSGVGKDTVVDQIKSKHPEIHYAITATTRPARTGESNGVSYHFRTLEQFRNLTNDGELFEWAEVYGNYYGVPKFELREAMTQRKDVIVKVDVQGAATIKGLIPNAVLIFIAPYSVNELLQRHFRRRTETGMDLSLRMETAKQEVAELTLFDYVIMNKQGELVRAVALLESIIAAERSRARPRVIAPGSF